MTGNAGQGSVFLLTDIEEITQDWERDQAGMLWALSRHDTLLRRAIEEHHGSVFKYVGDGFYAVFVDAADAVAAALDAQRALLGEVWGMSNSLSVRMAIHTGPNLSPGQDFNGAQLSRTVRLLNMAHGGQVLVAGALFDSLSDRLPAGCGLRDLGEYRLHDLSRPEHIYQLEATALPDDFPPLRSAGAQIAPAGPALRTELIGREREASALLGAILRADTGLITLTGPGGIGKTSLAIYVAGELDDHFEHGAYFVDMTQVADLTRLASTLAQALGVRNQGGQPLTQSLHDFMQGRRLMLVLDNLGTIEGSATLFEDLLSAAPRLKLLVTRREPIGMQGELAYAVPRLEMPSLEPLPPLARLADVSAVSLFVERAREVNPEFTLDASNAKAVAELSVRLDGLPLALELAAARVCVQSPQNMLDLLSRREAQAPVEDRVAVLANRTLRGAIASSYDLLDPSEKALFRRLGVFHGGASLGAIESVCLGWGDLDGDLLTVLLSLVDKNLLVQAPAAGREPRFHMLEAIRDIALEEARASGDLDEARQRHRRYFGWLSEGIVGETIRLPGLSGWDALTVDEENLRAAIQSAVESHDLESEQRLVGALAVYWSQRASFEEGLAYVKGALARSEGASPSQPLGRLFAGAGMLHWYTSDLTTVSAFLERSLTISREVGDVWIEVFALANGGLIAQFRGDGERALLLGQEAEVLSRSINDPMVRSLALGDLGRILILQGDFEAARSVLESGLDETHQSNSVWGQVTTSNSLGDVARITGDLTRAEELYRKALAAFVELGFVAEAASALHNLGHVRLLQGNADEALSNFTMALIEQRRVQNRAGIAECLMGIVGAWALQGRLEQAARLAGAVEVLREAIGDAMIWPAERIATEQIMQNLRSALPQDRLFAAMAEGRALSWEAAIAYVASEDQA